MNSISRHWHRMMFTTAVLGLAGGLWAQPAQPPAEAAQSQPAAQIDPRLANPRATMRTYLTAIADVMEKDQPQRIDEALDTMDMPARIRQDRGPELAKELREIINRVRFVVFDDIPEAGLEPYVFYVGKAGNVTIARQDDGRWLFSARTVEAIPEIYQELGARPVIAEVAQRAGYTEYIPISERFRGLMPEWLHHKGFLLEHWQWIGLLMLILIGLVLDRTIVYVLARLLHRWLLKSGVIVAGQVEGKFVRPVGLLAAALLWRLGLGVLGMPVRVEDVLQVAAKVLAIFSSIWLVYRAVDIICTFLERRAAATANKLDDLLVPLIRKTLKVFITILGFIFIAGMFEWELTEIMAGLGIGGLAFAFAARDTVANLFGSNMILLDRPFQIGDVVVVGDTEGIVEEVGFRSTRIRTFYNSLVTLPNANVANTSVDNYGARIYRRTKAYISLTYDTPPEKIEAFCEGIREIIRRHPRTRKDFFEVHFNQFADSSLNILLYCFHRVPNWSAELADRHRLFLDIVRLAKKIGVEFAFPTQTLHLYRQQQVESAVKSPPDRDAALTFGREQAAAITDQGHNDQKPG